MSKENNYNYVLDLVRMIAALSIVILHMSAADFHVLHCIKALTRFAVPFFFMISGYYSYGLNEGIWRGQILLRILKVLKLAIIMEIAAAIHRTATCGIEEICSQWMMPGVGITTRLLRIYGGGTEWIRRRMVFICAHNCICIIHTD